MKIFGLFLLAALLPGLLWAQGVGINTATPDASAALQVDGTRQGVLVPRMTQTERDAIVSPAEGLMLYNTTTHCLNMWNATQWIEFCSTTPPCSTPPAPSVISNSPACFGTSLTLNASWGPGATYIWTGPGGFYSTTEDPTINPLTPADTGTYTVRVFVAGCYSENTSHHVVGVPNPYTAVANFANTRYDAGSFVVGNKGYVVGGQSTSVYAYDAISNTWTARANFPTANYVDCDGWGYGPYGYMIEGQNTNRFLFRYDTTANTWTNIGAYPGTAVLGRAVAVIGDQAYVGVGNNSGGTKASDWFRYDIATNTWTPLAAISGGGVAYPACFALGTKVYVVGGVKGAAFSGFTTQTKIYDTATNTWSDGAAFPGTAFAEGFGLAIGGYGYVGLGNNGGGMNDEIYRYDPVANTWTRMPCDYPLAVSEVQPFVMANGNAYISCGYTGASNTQSVYRFNP